MMLLILQRGVVWGGDAMEKHGHMQRRGVLTLARRVFSADLRDSG
ncbi:MAG TPA: hypothetical protein VMU45_07450 [Candidatus Eisenbacteria bacterium]|nr:hypothetical protein [Candidatus Eisenbacteria bacterium]